MPAGQPGAEVADPARWVDNYADALYAFALARVADPNLAEDLVQETFLAGLAAIDGFRSESSLLTWLTGILRRKIADDVRLRKRRPHQQSPPAEQAAGAAPFDHRGKWTPKIRAWPADPQEIAQSREFWEVFETCIDLLPPTLAAAFRLRHVDGHATRDVCSELQITDGNLSVRLHRAKLSLRECLDRHWFEKPSRTEADRQEDPQNAV